MEFVTQNGTEINIVTAPTRSVMRLKREVMKHLKNRGIVDNLDSGNLLNLKLDDVLNLLIDIDTSEEFEKAIFECLKVCIYDTNGKKLRISEQLFDDIPEAREDYYEIIAKCCEVNLRPFFKSLVSQFLILFPTKQNENQKQESQQMKE